MEDISLYGLIGYPLGHSFSETYFADKFAREGIRNASYKCFPLKTISELPSLLESCPNLRGFNVTIPYKEQIIDYLDRLDPVAQAIGAVNCVYVGENGSLTGYNTDAPAFRDELLKMIGRDRPSALVLGSGGASKAVAFILRELEIEYVTISRSRGDITYKDVTPGVIRNHKLIINTTPLGMFPDTQDFPPLPYQHLTSDHYMFDLIYNPERTQFMKHGEDRGAKTVNGYGMLVGQAELSWSIWTGDRHRP